MTIPKCNWWRCRELQFYDKYIKTDNRKKYIDNDGIGVPPKQKDIKFYNEKYQDTYGNRRHVIYKPKTKDTRMRRVHSGRKRKATGFVHLQGLPYSDSKGSSNIRSCIHDGLINADPIIDFCDKLELYR